MARIFISHSSRNAEPAARIKVWLSEQGFESVFLDFDKDAGIRPGAAWERTLYREIARSHAVILVLTPEWHASKWCWSEFTQARALGKAIFPVIEAASGETLIAPDIQHLDLRRDRDGGLERLARALDEVARQQHDFPWDGSRSPYPGLLSFQEDDAAIYFGRDDDVRAMIERLNARRTQGGAHLIALLGASGSGKSSLLRAGVVPRLRRDRSNWIALSPFRPQLRPLDEFAAALAAAIGEAADWRGWRARLSGEDARGVLLDLARDLRARAEPGGAGAADAQILIAIDQAEELFGIGDREQAASFLKLLSVALQEDMPFLVVAAMRSDSLEKLQRAEELQVPFEEFSLKPMPLVRVPEIVEGPARIAGLTVESALVVRLGEDADTEDAMPLLAFALRELYEGYGSSRRMLTLEDYERLGDRQLGLTPLENAVRKSADQVLEAARVGDAELAALREAFVPAMVRVNDRGEYVRRPARWRDMPEAALPLLDRLAQARLLVVRHNGAEKIVEVAHEALLRKWPRVRAWLDEEREFLIGKARLEQALQEWQAAPEASREGALLHGLQLDRARAWLADHRGRLSEAERDFIAASDAHARRLARSASRQKMIVFASLAVLALVGAVGGPRLHAAWQQQRAVDREAARTDIAGAIVAYAAVPGTDAMDVLEGNDSKDSPYTTPLVRALRDPRRGLLEAIQDVHQEVTRTTRGRQRPFLSTSLNGHLYLWQQPATRVRLAIVVSADIMQDANGPRLIAPKGDGDVVANLLRDAGFRDGEIVRLHNVDKERLEAEIAAACARLHQLRPPPAKSAADVSSGRRSRIVTAGVTIIDPAAPSSPSEPTKPPDPPPLDKSNSLIFFYFSGPGFDSRGRNYLFVSSGRNFVDKTLYEPINVDIEPLKETISSCAKAAVIILDTSFPESGSRR